MSESLVLYDNAFSPYAFKVRATLYEKNIEHEKREMRYASDREALLALNPRGEIPAIQHGDTVVTDSSLICDYLESHFPDPPLLPESAAGADFLEAMTNSGKDAHPFFASEHPHMRDHRLEWCFRLGLGSWLAGELEADRLAFSPVP